MKLNLHFVCFRELQRNSHFFLKKRLYFRCIFVFISLFKIPMKILFIVNVICKCLWHIFSKGKPWSTAVYTLLCFYCLFLEGVNIMVIIDFGRSLTSVWRMRWFHVKAFICYVVFITIMNTNIIRIKDKQGAPIRYVHVIIFNFLNLRC